MSTPTRWHGCYTESWQDLCVPEAFSHPAKFSRGLIHRIYRYALEQRSLQPGMTVLDPFGGVALGALDAQTYGLSWLGCELEPRFHALGLANLALWRRRYGFSTGALVCGDSRELRQIVAGAWQGVITSPPFLDADNRGNLEQLKALRAQLQRDGKAHGGDIGRSIGHDYGTTPGQFGAMPAGAVVTSPPYERAVHHGNGIDATKLTGNPAGQHSQAHAEGYGTTPGNLGNLKAGAVVTSPPYAEAINRRGEGPAPVGAPHSGRWQASAQSSYIGYGFCEGQLGNTTADTFWQAAAAILTECHALLAPQSVAIFVLKDYVRNKQRVPFCAHWRACCEAVGYTFVEEIHAMLVEDHGTQTGLFEPATTVTTERKSFFRRLAERKGSPRIDWETVLVMRRP